MNDGLLLYVYNYEFSDGSTKNKFFLIIKDLNNSQIIVSLPTSKDYIPSYAQINHGCINVDRAQQTTYCFAANNEICDDTTFSFDVDTFLYGHLIENIDISNFFNRYPVKGVHYEIKGILKTNELLSLTNCFKNSDFVKNKFKKVL